MIYLERDDIILLHTELIKQFGGSYGIRDAKLDFKTLINFKRARMRSVSSLVNLFLAKIWFFHLAFIHNP